MKNGEAEETKGKNSEGGGTEYERTKIEGGRKGQEGTRERGGTAKKRAKKEVRTSVVPRNTSPRREREAVESVEGRRKEEGELASVTLGLFLKFGFRCLSPFYSRKKEKGTEGKGRKAKQE